ncbi:MAG: ATP-binding cassette domain-containing protein, partial [Burkholderiales bacterium]|nr:ATP-binding cassette domain-containing protein [Burkholderiales bacterium]
MPRPAPGVGRIGRLGRAPRRLPARDGGSPMSANAVELEGVSVRYGRGMAFARTWFDAVKQVDLRIETGETLGLVGESGSGKSTRAKVCLGLLRPSQGRARLEDEDLFGIGRRRPGSLAAVLQHPEWSL